MGGNIGYITQNAAHARSRGAELELAGLPATGVSVGGSLGYADAHYLQYTNGCGAGCNLDGYRLNSPRLTLATFGQYERAISDSLDWMLRLDFSYRSDTPGTVINPTAADGNIYPYHLGGFGLLDGRLGIRSHSGWQVYLWSQNLLDRNYLVDRDAYTNLAILGVTQTGLLYGSPRTYGIRAEYRF